MEFAFLYMVLWEYGCRLVGLRLYIYETTGIGETFFPLTGKRKPVRFICAKPREKKRKDKEK